MKKNYITSIISNECIVDNIFKLTVGLDEDLIARPGQFVQLKLPSDEFTLRRPLGIADLNRDRLTMFYRIVGRGTQFLSTLREGMQLELLAPLGNGFNFRFGEKILLVGGGLGLAPLIFAAHSFDGTDILIGGKNKSEAEVWQKEFDGAVSEMFIATDDGSLGFGGFVTELLPEVLLKKNYDAIFLCGPMIMMQRTAELAHARGVKCFVSLESRMGCGLGACLSCSIDTRNGRKKICKDGPIFNAEDVFDFSARS